MALTERTRLYEVLIRFHQPAEGPPTMAAHQLKIHEIIQDGVVISARELPAEVLDPTLVKSLVGDQLPGLIVERDTLVGALAELAESKAALATERDDLMAERTALISERDALTTRQDALVADITKLRQAAGPVDYSGALEVAT